MPNTSNHTSPTYQLQTLGITPSVFYALEDQQLQQDHVLEAYSSIGTLTPAQHEAFTGLMRALETQAIPAPAKTDPVAEEFPQLLATQETLLQQAGLTTSDIAMAVALLNHHQPWDFNDLHDMLFHLARFSQAEGRPPSMEELEECYDEHEPEETAQADLEVEKSDPENVYEENDQYDTPETFAWDFADEYGGLWLALRTATLMVEQTHRENAENAGMEEDKEAIDPKVAAMYHSNTREAALLAIYPHFANDDVRIDTMRALSFDHDNLLELQLFYLMEEVAFHPGEDITPSFFDALQKANILIDGSALATAIEKDAERHVKRLTEELEGKDAALATQERFMEQMQQNHEAVQAANRDEIAKGKQALRDANRSKLHTAALTGALGLGLGAGLTLGVQKCTSLITDEANPAEKTRTWTPPEKKSAANIRTFAAPKAADESFQDSENARQQAKINAETVTTMTP